MVKLDGFYMVGITHRFCRCMCVYVYDKLVMWWENGVNLERLIILGDKQPTAKVSARMSSIDRI